MRQQKTQMFSLKVIYKVCHFVVESSYVFWSGEILNLNEGINLRSALYEIKFYMTKGMYMCLVLHGASFISRNIYHMYVETITICVYSCG